MTVGDRYETIGRTHSLTCRPDPRIAAGSTGVSAKRAPARPGHPRLLAQTDAGSCVAGHGNTPRVLEKAGLSVEREIDHGDRVEVICRITR